MNKVVAVAVSSLGKILIVEKGGNNSWEHREGAHDFKMREKLMAAINEKKTKTQEHHAD